MSVEITRRTLPPQPALIIRRRIQRSQIAATLSEVLPKVYEYAQRRGVPLASPPITRYVQMGFGAMTIEGGFAVAVASGDAQADAEIEAIELPGGPAAVAIHRGAYDRLPETHAAIEAWIAAEKLEASGAPWEIYVTDPAEKPNPEDWRTEVVYPLVR